MNFLHRLATTLQKHAYAQTEPVRMSDVCNMEAVSSAQVIDTPYRHVIIDDIFTKEFYGELRAYFNRKKAEGLFTKMRDESHPYGDASQPYDGELLPLAYEEGAVTEFLFSNQWNLYLSRLLGRVTDQTTALALHFHPSGDNTGWVHNDYATKKFDRKNSLANKVIPFEWGVPRAKTADVFFSCRAIALVYYFNNDAPEAVGAGGATLLFAKEGDALPSVSVAPKNNRLLAFSVTPQTYHVFQENHFDRASLVQWLHVDEEWCIAEFHQPPKPYA